MPTFDSARALLNAVQARYRTLVSYSDVGQVTTRLLHGAHVRSFETASGAGGDFRFLFRSPHPYRPLQHRVTTHIVGRCSGQAYLHSRRPDGQANLQNMPDLDMGVAAATGISGGAAHTIASLLYAEVSGWRLADMRRPRRRAPRWVEGVWCHRITGLQGRTPVVVYVGVEDLLVRKFADRKGRTEEARREIDIQQLHPAEHFQIPR